MAVVVGPPQRSSTRGVCAASVEIVVGVRSHLVALDAGRRRIVSGLVAGGSMLVAAALLSRVGWAP